MKQKVSKAKPVRIGELAARTGRSVHAIRWYETQGLIPGVRRDAGGRRTYSERHQSWLELIDRLRVTGMSIAQMREYTKLVQQGRLSLKEQQTVLRDHQQRVRETIKEWQIALALLDRKIVFYEEWIATGMRPASEPETVTLRGRLRRAKRAGSTAK